ncbi:MAG: sulfotransferase [Spirochaetes bacterium]|nr:sulfotransferase [Spirochaetota bacterium]
MIKKFIAKITRRFFYTFKQMIVSLGFRLKDPIVIIGTGRCGSTLLLKVLGSHKELIIYKGEGNEYWHPVSYPYAKRSIETPPYVVNPALFTQKSLEHWPKKHTDFVKKYFTGIFFEKKNKFNEKFVYKSVMITFMLPIVLKLFPGAKFIHIYRNGPSVVKSFLKKEWHKYQDYFNSEEEYMEACSQYWNTSVLEIEKQVKELKLSEKKQIIEMSYEDLCSDPQTQIDKIATFLGINPAKFDYDFSQISSTNFKVGDYKQDKEWINKLALMQEGMQLKGFL